jgi:hypothetical protein
MARRTNHLMTGHLKTKMTIIGVFVAIFWMVEILDQFVFDHQLNQYEIISSSLPFGLRWILFAPFLHGSFKDLIVGTIGFVILGLSVMSYKIRHFWIVTIITMIVGGLGIWRFNPYDPHPIGASILIFGYLAFLLFRSLAGAEADSTGQELSLSAFLQPVDERNLLDNFMMHSLTLIFALPGYVLYGLSTIGIHNLFGVPAHIASGFFAGTLAADFICQDKGRAMRWKLFWISFPIVFLLALLKMFAEWFVDNWDEIKIIMAIVGFGALLISSMVGGSSSTSGEQKDTIPQAGHAEARHRDRVEAEERYRQWKEQEQRDWEEQQRQNNEDR